MTVRDLIKGSLRLIKVLAAGEVPKAEEQTEAFEALNSMINTWSAEGLMIFKVTPEEFTLTANDGSYTLGASGGDFTTSRPSEIIRASLKSGNSEYPVSIINTQEYADIPDKTSTSTIPQKLYIDGGYPLLTLKLWPVPSAANTLVLYSLKPLTAFSSVNDTVSLPPGFEEALKFNLAKRLAIEYGAALSAEADQIARDSLTVIKRKNSRPTYLRSDVMGLTFPKQYNIFKGDY
jgi:hypothetical protein